MGTAAAGAAALGVAAGATSLVPKVAASAIAGEAGPSAPRTIRTSTTNRALPIPVPTSWSRTADVVVVGYGGAGAATAITAYDAGANVLVLEKSPSLASLGVPSTNAPNAAWTISGGGGDTHMAGGECIWPTDPIGGAQYLYSTCVEGATPYDVCEAWATVANGNKAWFDKIGIKYTVTSNAGAWPNAPGASGISVLHTAGDGAALFGYMDQAVQSRGIPILFNTPGIHLIQDSSTGEVLGVQALQNYSEILNIRANRAVVLTTGGFDFNDAMMASFLKLYPQHFYGWQYNTGDGLNMAQEVGAGMWHMFGGPSGKGAWFPEYAAAYTASIKNNAWIQVNKYGQRWMDEEAYTAENFEYALLDYNITGTNPPATSASSSTVPEYSRIPYFLVFDSTGFKAGAIGTTSNTTGSFMTSLPPQVGGGPLWSTDNSAELAKGWIIEGATSIADLANAINSAKIVTSTWANAQPITIDISPSVLTATVNQWNTDCAAGKGDSVFGRPASTMLPISTPPFYAMAMYASKYNTTGGPIRNAQAQVCDPYSNPIPRLYSAGSLGSILGINYPGGGSDISECVAFGQIAGNNATNEIPWTS